MKTKQSQLYVGSVEPGQEFTYLGQQYIRATEAQETRHPARDLRLQRTNDIVLAYATTYRNGRPTKTPVSFVVANSDGAFLVWVKKAIRS